MAVRSLDEISAPHERIEAGGDLLVVGRPITEAHLYGFTGLEAANAIADEIGKAQ